MEEPPPPGGEVSIAQIYLLLPFSYLACITYQLLSRSPVLVVFERIFSNFSCLVLHFLPCLVEGATQFFILITSQWIRNIFWAVKISTLYKFLSLYLFFFSCYADSGSNGEQSGVAWSHVSTVNNLWEWLSVTFFSPDDSSWNSLWTHANNGRWCSW